MTDISSHAGQIEELGYSIIPAVFDAAWVNDWTGRVNAVFESASASIRSSRGSVYAARNVITELEGAKDLCAHPGLEELLSQTLGKKFVCVRALYFDKHPDRTWSLPWHKDMTIAVKDNTIACVGFSKPTTKSGVPHLEASTSILENMLTLRIHLDDVTLDNGPLEVAPGSHKNGKRPDADGHQLGTILVNAGDVLAMRPLLSHASGSSTPGTEAHRRILHFEFSGDRQLPGGLQWYYAD